MITLFAERYIDLEAGAIDTEAQSLLNELKHKRIQQKLCKDNIYHYTVQWDEKGINLENTEHAEYLKKLDQDVETNLRRLFEV